ncbi:MAG TPA: alpha/beta hydrolase [Moraxellaceae bacterium]|nr:alpha/beta hydrolase [Moraxellaceae bacterium]
MRSRPQPVLARSFFLLLLLSLSLPAQAFSLFRDHRMETVRFTPKDWPAPLDADLYLPEDKKKAPYPVLLLIHGGAWHKGDKASMAKAGKVLADRGFAALAINYRLAPRFRYPAPVEDAQQALRWLQKHATKYRLDTGRVGVWGYSAGAHLAALLAVQPVTTDVPELRVVIAGSAPTDLRQSTQASVRAFLGADASAQPALYEDASPLARVHPGLPPFLLYYGSADTLVAPSQSENFARALKEAGVTVKVIRIEGADHRSAAQGVRQHLDEVLGYIGQQMSPAARRRAAATP